jgi:hypothetical protein
MSAVFVVVAGINYDGSTPVRVFAEKQPADDFAKACHEYEQTRPLYPDGNTIEEIKAWGDGLKAWQDKHPGGENGHGSDYFVVIEVPFGPLSSTAAQAATDKKG